MPLNLLIQFKTEKIQLPFTALLITLIDEFKSVPVYINNNNYCNHKKYRHKSKLKFSSCFEIRKR